MSLEQRLIDEIRGIDRRLAELTQEKRSLERLLLRTRRENAANQDVTRRNSFARILLEKTILESFTVENKPLSSRELWVRAFSVDNNLKQSTFRSYLHRMKKRGLIRNTPNQSRSWQLVSP